MLKKLIAYDFGCTWKTVVLLLSTSGFGALLAMGLGFIEYRLNFEKLTEVVSMMVAAGLALGQSFSSMLAYFSLFGITLLVVIHYYKKFISDEAYLTFTLPATPGQHLLSKMIMGFVWNMIAGVMMLIDSVLIDLPMQLMYADVYEDLNGIYSPYFDGISPAEYLVLMAAILLVAIAFVIAELGMIYLCLTVGGVIAHKHKALAGLALYWLANGFVTFVIVLIGVIFSAITVIPFELTLLWTIVLMLLICSVVITVFGVIFYFINRSLLTKKLNLP